MKLQPVLIPADIRAVEQTLATPT